VDERRLAKIAISKKRPPEILMAAVADIMDLRISDIRITYRPACPSHSIIYSA
jgi:hypothetical protein